MIRVAEKLYTQLQTRLGEETRDDGVYLLHQVQQCFEICNNAVLMLCEKIKEKRFRSKKQEILFFRSVKPRFVSLQQYYVLLYNHIMFIPDEEEEKVKYLERSLQKLERHMAEQHWFYLYFQSGSSHLDHKYFLRPEPSDLNTPGEILISDITAHQELAEYIRREIKSVQPS